MTLMSLRAVLCTVALAGCTTVLTGCGINPGTVLSSSPETGSLSPISGKAFGGQQPLYGSHVYVYATGLGGRGTASTSVLNANSGTADSKAMQDGSGNYYVVTNNSGFFTISSAPSCIVGTQAYLYITGGNPGVGTNSATALLSPLGPCTSSSTVVPPVAFVQANEVTTVVTAYALAGFATSPTAIASGSGTLSKTGLANAMSTALNIVSVATGLASATTTTGNAIVPVDKINLMANALAGCINTSGPTTSGCTSLYTDTGTTAGSDTATVALALAHVPFLSSAHAMNLYTLGNPPGAPIFPVNLSGPPADFTLGLQYKTPQYTTGGVVNYSLAVDSTGSLWTRGTNTAGTTATFVKYSPLGSASTTITVPSASNSSYSPYIHLAIDSTDTVWSGTLGGEIKIASGASTYTTLGNGSCALTTDSLASTVFGSNGVTYVGGLNGGNIWQFNSTGCTGSLTPPSSIVFKGFLAPEKGGGFVASAYKNNNTQDNSYVLRYAAGATTPSSFLAGGDFLTTDNSGDVWAYSTVGGQSPFAVLNEYNATNAGISPSAGYGQGGMQTKTINIRSGTEAPHIDGAGAAWLTVTPCDSPGNCSAEVVVGLQAGLGNGQNAITPSTGLALPNGETLAHTLALDGSGNLWISVADGALIQYVGLTTPVATPVLSTNVGTTP